MDHDKLVRTLRAGSGIDRGYDVNSGEDTTRGGCATVSTSCTGAATCQDAGLRDTSSHRISGVA